MHVVKLTMDSKQNIVLAFCLSFSLPSILAVPTGTGSKRPLHKLTYTIHALGRKQRDRVPSPPFKVSRPSLSLFFSTPRYKRAKMIICHHGDRSIHLLARITNSN
ncbi:hypothetical protein GGR58DRAFT_72680 [Xylaria digitata]|nr:hypothetical protein GGR58DRAFT_72680 [Xylaria digitata]